MSHLRWQEATFNLKDIWPVHPPHWLSNVSGCLLTPLQSQVCAGWFLENQTPGMLLCVLLQSQEARAEGCGQIYLGALEGLAGQVSWRQCSKKWRRRVQVGGRNANI